MASKGIETDLNRIPARKPLAKTREKSFTALLPFLSLSLLILPTMKQNRAISRDPDTEGRRVSYAGKNPCRRR
jgi:hypothetical protein